MTCRAGNSGTTGGLPILYFTKDSSLKRAIHETQYSKNKKSDKYERFD